MIDRSFLAIKDISKVSLLGTLGVSRIPQLRGSSFRELIRKQRITAVRVNQSPH